MKLQVEFANERSGAKGGLDLPLDWICLAARLRLHPAFASLDRFQPVCHKRFDLPTGRKSGNQVGIGRIISPDCY